MAAKTITLNGAVIHKENYDTKTLLTTLKGTSRFDQIAAAAMDVKSTIFDESGMRRTGCKKWNLEWVKFGAELTMMPHQMAVFGDKPLSLHIMKITADDVLKQDADSALKFNFTMIVSNPAGLRDFLLIVKRGECAATIQLPDRETEKHAQAEASKVGLFAVPKDPKPTKEAKGNAAVVPPVKKNENPPTENPPSVKPEEPPKESGALASHAAMGQPTLRGRGRMNKGK